ncbi:MAG: neutral/alkaline non-lysosomal ceramidase N-terminal domain-containing protein [Clostridia bacterium]|nr:neutral/alkaline non-lysosomal ceramidase N-terminal domain-containing protein [Clostridia bacterium]
MSMVRKFMAVLLAAALLLAGCAPVTPENTEAVYTAGFASVSLPVPTDSDEPLYIAGYHSGWEITGVLDEQRAQAVWLDDGTTSLLLISVDCVGLSSATVAEIRNRLGDFVKQSGCDSVNVISTHTHAGLDTLGLWGDIAMNGKNSDFMQTLIDGAVEAAQAAYANRTTGKLTYTVTETADLQEDSRDPQVYDKNLYQLRFVPDDAAKNAIRIWSFAAHAEALRSENTKVSRDYPGAVSDRLKAETGDDLLYLPGAIGGLIMTPRMTPEPFDGEQNLAVTGQRIATVMQLKGRSRELQPEIAISRVTFDVALDNTLFRYYRFLGILENEVHRGLFGGYTMKTELTLIRLGDLTLALLPGELFPELVIGTGEDGDPTALRELAAEYGVEELMIIGLANDEIGYIVTPSDYVLDADLPYVQEAEGEHYEETNSVGREAACALAKAFEKALKKLK